MGEVVWRAEDVTPEAARWVMSPPGQAVLADLVADHGTDPLAVAARLRSRGLTPSRAATAQSVAAASAAAWARGQPTGTWWTPAAAEQASHPTVAAWRAHRVAGASTVDLTAGCGADALAMTAVAAEVVACERSETRLPFLRANLPATTAVVRADAVRPCVQPSRHVAWADPGRRVDGRRVRGIARTRPPVPALVEAGWAGAGIAVSPGLDLQDPARPPDAELEFVQVGRELVEATIWLGDLRATGPGAVADASATLLPAGVHRRGRPGPPRGPIVQVGGWLAEPAPALVRARLADDVAEELGLHRIAERRALFTGPAPVRSPWFRVEEVEAVVAARPARVRAVLASLDERPVELLTHGLAADLGAWHRGVGRPPTGPRGRAVHLIRLDRGSVAVVTRRGDG